jgi:putative ATP-dependent endonuclease of the OLD family
MFLSELKIWNFRKFISKKIEGEQDLPGLHLKFNPGFNLLVGENDSGKSAVIDAIKLVLLTQSREFQSIDYDDFNLPKGSDDDKRANNLRIECIFRDIKNTEAKHFLEWMGFEIDANREKKYVLRVFLQATRDHRKVFSDIGAGPNEGRPLDSRARDYLRITYLKPLRDAEFELYPRRNSRLSQILDSHQAFGDKEDHAILNAIKKANSTIDQYFKGKDECGNEIADREGKALLDQINKYLLEFSSEKNKLNSELSISETKLKSILERLNLDLIENKAGLGSHNLLFISAELLLLQRANYSGLKLALIEEIEAHLHPQSQLRMIEFLQNESKDLGAQLILTSHSPNLASKISLENIQLCKNGRIFHLGKEYTNLEDGDYLFLQRFLDVTKANLFFAEGVILVEGDAENLLIPTIAEIIGKPLSRYGVSIVNVGSTAFLRYSKIFQRKDATYLIEIPVACVTDCDVKPDLFKNKDMDAKTLSDYPEGISGEIERKKALYSGQHVEVFVSPKWTLEYTLALSSLRKELYRAILYAKAIKNSDKYVLTEQKRQKIKTDVVHDFEKWQTDLKSDEEIAFEIYNNTMLEKSVSKAIVAQCFAKILEDCDRDELRSKISTDVNIRYLIDAINYATGQGS